MKEFREENKEIVKIAKLKRLKQGGRTIKEFIQKFRRIIRESGYKKRLLIEEFKRGMNRIIYQRLMESK